MLLAMILWILGAPELEHYSISTFFLVILFPISIGILVMLFCKKGILIKNGNLYKTQFFFGKVLKKKQLSLDRITDISLLSFNGTQKFAWSSMAKPDQGYEVKRYELYLLNENHTVKLFLISTSKKELAVDSINIIAQELGLVHSVYNPRF
ncbi:hypothetical protein GCM10022393_27860 [Aquimarina addita]|uniref:Uncharacterized protein n=2 Tax=Aquimarina addita TaxID=870485 RepID=A0ABP6UNI7_9FLAO